MIKLKKSLIVMLLLTLSMAISGCGLGGNEDFEYMNQRNIMKVTIQSIRDKSYKFTVTDDGVINDIYSILSSASVVEEKSTLDPDYILEIYTGPTEVKTFNYVAGLDKKDGGNLYDEDSKYIVSKRLDEDIIKNFANIRKPINFKYIYYTSIFNCLNNYVATQESKENIGIKISEDTMAARFQITTEIEEFKNDLGKVDNVVFIDDSTNTENLGVVMNIKTEGYTSTKYKGIVAFRKNTHEEGILYYISSVYEQGEWKINISQDKPEGF